MEALFETISRRLRPEDVAQMIMETLGDSLTHYKRRILNRAAAGSLKRALSQFASMMEDFARPIAPERQVRKAVELFSTAYPITTADCAGAEKVEAFIRHISAEIGKTYGRSDFKSDRLNKLQSESATIDLSKRRYNKLFRHLIRLERKVRTYVREQRKYEFTRISKSSLAGRISWEDFSRDRDSACFIAYYVARCNLRSEFTTLGQQRPYDEIADMLFTPCKQRHDQANWWAIAHVFPETFALAQLTDAQKGRLLGAWLSALYDIASLLKEVWERGDINRERTALYEVMIRACQPERKERFPSMKAFHAAWLVACRYII
jgi:hypothetical protein